MLLISKKEAREQGLTMFFTGKPCSRGHIAERKVSNHSCIICHREGCIKWNAIHYRDHKDKHQVLARRHYLANKPKYKAAARQNYQNNKEAHKAYDRQYYQNNKGYYRAACAKRHAVKLERTPPWVDLCSIKKFYVACPEGYEVDHIIPLQGKTVSGLHVLNNLQYLTITENRSKSNSFYPLEHEEILC